MNKVQSLEIDDREDLHLIRALKILLIDLIMDKIFSSQK